MSVNPAFGASDSGKSTGVHGVASREGPVAWKRSVQRKNGAYKIVFGVGFGSNWTCLASGVATDGTQWEVSKRYIRPLEVPASFSLVPL